MDSLIVKLGGSVITDKSRKFKVREDALNRLAKELKSTYKSLIVIHGGGSFGHPLASKYGIDAGYKDKSQLMGFALTHRAMQELNGKVINAMHDNDIPAVSIQPSACVIVKNGEIESIEISPIRKFLDLGIIPVLYGDTVPDMGKGMSILSGDQLAVYLGLKLSVKRVILGVDTDGVYTSDPKNNEKAELLSSIRPEDWREIKDYLSKGNHTDVTGGMKRKVKELLKLPESGIEAQIVNASKPGVLKRTIKGDKNLGTRIM